MHNDKNDLGDKIFLKEYNRKWSIKRIKYTNLKIFNNSEGTESQKYVLYTNSIYLKKEGHTSEYVAQLSWFT